MKNTYQKGAVGVIVIILILLAGVVGYYLWSKSMSLDLSNDTIDISNQSSEPVGFEEEPSNLPVAPKSSSTTPPAGDAQPGGINGGQVENPNIPVVTEEPILGATVNMKGFRFSPSLVTIKAGESVEWINDDYADHNVVSQLIGGFNSGNLAPGNIYILKFAEPGTYTYYCTYHPNMTGTVIVE